MIPGQEQSLSMPTVLAAFCGLIETHWASLHTGNLDTYDFQPFDTFQSEEDVIEAIFYDADHPHQAQIAAQFRVFGRDGAGGDYAIWLKYPNKDLTDQPVVLFDSEGGYEVVADNIGQFMWFNTIADDESGKPVLQEPLLGFVREWAPEVEDSLREQGYDYSALVDQASQRHADFVELIDAVWKSIEQ